ncbi:hypothetical protein GS482_31515 [Rhodococcus hoagii]|nr:hypothetical protein [Prescottella equi]
MDRRRPHRVRCSGPKALIEQYNDFEPKDTAGPSTSTAIHDRREHIGDLGGLSIALERTGSPPRAPRLRSSTSWTACQRVFFGWAQVWRTKARKEEALRRLQSTRTRRRSSPLQRRHPQSRQLPRRVRRPTGGRPVIWRPEKRVKIW